MSPRRASTVVGVPSAPVVRSAYVTKVDSPLDELRALAADHRDIRFALGYQDRDAVDLAGVDGAVRQPGDAARSADPRSADELRAEAVAAARECDTTIVFLGLPLREEEEARDRTSLELPVDQQTLVNALLETGTRLVVVLLNGSATTMSPWPAAAAIVQAGLLGQGSGWAIAQVLFGLINPSGRLAETVPVRLEDTPAFVNFPGERAHVRYGEGVFVGYRWYDAARIAPRFAFGHGLSFTTFEYSDLRVDVTDAAAGNVAVTARVTKPWRRRPTLSATSDGGAVARSSGWDTLARCSWRVTC